MSWSIWDAFLNNGRELLFPMQTLIPISPFSASIYIPGLVIPHIMTNVVRRRDVFGFGMLLPELRRKSWIIVQLANLRSKRLLELLISLQLFLLLGKPLTVHSDKHVSLHIVLAVFKYRLQHTGLALKYLKCALHLLHLTWPI